ncbi:MAG: uroporphyrinogen decarboxylase family protein [Clostridia bacterium]|nr:uroporphyrinogen decarboxylase family protein [Clostridia bacterium]
MKANMKQWMNDLLTAKEKKAMPVLSFPSISLMNIGVDELIKDSSIQAKGMKMIADRVPSAASVSMMDLSVEAEAFGSTIKVLEGEVPTVIGSIVNDPDEAEALEVPHVGAGRTGLYIEAIKKACELITDRPVFAGVIGPFSLAGRLQDVSEIMVNCYVEPEMVKTTMEKATKFLIEYINAYKTQTGAGGVVMAEPLTGLLSPALAEEFSAPYVKEIIDAVQDDNFLVIYHNCGDNTIQQIDAILSQGAAAYHFGNAIDMEEMLAKCPADAVIMGNIDPAGQIKNGTPESVREATISLMEKCCPKYPNFAISTGCDVPPLSPWENIDAFFAAVDEYYASVR